MVAISTPLNRDLHSGVIYINVVLSKNFLFCKEVSSRYLLVWSLVCKLISLYLKAQYSKL